jgi:hypothetical protein
MKIVSHIKYLFGSNQLRIVLLFFIINFINFTLYSQGKLKENNALSIGLHKNFILNREYVVADTTSNQHLDTYLPGYKREYNLSYYIGWNHILPISNQFYFFTGVELKLHNEIYSSMKDSLLKYYINNNSIFISKNAYNIEVPLLLSFKSNRFQVLFGISLHLLTYQISSHEFLNDNSKKFNEFFFFEQNHSMEYNSIRRIDFYDWRIALTYNIDKSIPLFITTGFNSLGEINIGLIFYYSNK